MYIIFMEPGFLVGKNCVHIQSGILASIHVFVQHDMKMGLEEVPYVLVTPLLLSTNLRDMWHHVLRCGKTLHNKRQKISRCFETL